MQKDFLTKIKELYERGEEGNLLTVVDENISADQAEFVPGDRMLWTEEDELYCSRPLPQKLRKTVYQELKKIAAKENSGLFTVEVKDKEIEVYIQNLKSEPQLYIFGAGHVSSPLARIAEIAGFSVTVIDDREDLLEDERFTENIELIRSSYQDYLKEFKAGPGDYIVIVTPGHKNDYEVLKELVDQRWTYLGMIGSQRKVDLIYEELKEQKDGVKDRLQEVDAPIGLEIGSETPEEIAVSISAALISTRRCRR